MGGYTLSKRAQTDQGPVDVAPGQGANMPLTMCHSSLLLPSDRVLYQARTGNVGCQGVGTRLSVDIHAGFHPEPGADRLAES